MKFVIDEWFLDRLSTQYTNESTERKTTVEFIKTFLNNNDRLAVKVNSPFVYKLNKNNKTYQTQTELRNIYKEIQKRIFTNSEKCRMVENNEKPLPESVIKLLALDRIDAETNKPVNFNSDTYDEKLQKRFEKDTNFDIRITATFLEDY
jgi:hypothetical protein